MFKQKKIYPLLFCLVFYLLISCENPVDSLDRKNIKDPLSFNYIPDSIENFQGTVTDINITKLSWAPHIGAQYYQIERKDLQANTDYQALREQYQDVQFIDTVNHQGNFKYRVSAVAKNNKTSSVTSTAILTTLLSGQSLEIKPYSSNPIIVYPTTSENILYFEFNTDGYDFKGNIWEFNSSTLEWKNFNAPEITSQTFLEYYFSPSDGQILFYGAEQRGQEVNLIFDTAIKNVSISKSSSFFVEENIPNNHVGGFFGLNFVSVSNTSTLITGVKDVNTPLYNYESYAGIYNGESDKIINVTPMNFYRAFHKSILTSNGNILTCGGQFTYNTKTDDPSCEIYDVSSNTWEVLHSISHPLYAPVALKISEDSIFWIETHQDFKTVLIYNSNTQEWEKIVSPEHKIMPRLLNNYNYDYGNSNREFNNPILKLDDDNLLALTRDGEHYFFEIYNLPLNKWKKPLQLPDRISEPSSMNLLQNNRILLLHQDSEEGTLYSEIYYF